MAQWRVLANRWQNNSMLLGAMLASFVALKVYFHGTYNTGSVDIATDMVFALMGLFLFWDRIQIKWTWRHLGWVSIGFCALAGWGFYQATVRGFTWLPFDYATLEKQLQLLVLYPLIEEICYRFTLLWLLIRLVRSPQLAVILSCVIFGLASSWESSYVPSSMQSFLYFKWFTLAAVSYWWGYRYMKTKSLLVPIGLHFFFKVGFFLGLLQ